jgi:hypothetical protein
MEPDMNRHERRTKLQRRSGVAVLTQTFQNAAGNFYWFVKPAGWTKADGVPWRYAEIFGPFATEADVARHQRIFLLGPVTSEQLAALADRETATEH